MFWFDPKFSAVLKLYFKQIHQISDICSRKTFSGATLNLYYYTSFSYREQNIGLFKGVWQNIHREHFLTKIYSNCFGKGQSWAGVG